ncbi:MAG: hypothetical protein PHT32_07865 [Candidatus Omnitrophica bacterium]|nr:hypothetical protein [Candidatus Omnitrophota bacterium]
MKKFTVLKWIRGSLVAVILACPVSDIAQAKGITYADDDSWPILSGKSLDLKSQKKPEDQFANAQKIAYIRGLYEALMAQEMSENQRSKLLAKLPKYEPENLVQELDEFFSDYNNSDIPAINALIIINERDRGAAKERIKKLTEAAKDANLNIDRLF